MTASTFPSTLDRTWTEDSTGLRLETHVGHFAVDVVRGDAGESVRVRGELDIATAPLLWAVLDTVYARQPSRVEVDLSAVTFLDAAALATLLAVRRDVARRNVVLVLLNPSQVVCRVLGLTGMDGTLDPVEAPLASPSPRSGS